MMTRRAFLWGATGAALSGFPLVGIPSGAVPGGRSFMEVYSFTCPHCYKLSLQLRVWLPLNPTVKHYPVHIVSTADDLKLAAAGYAAAVLGKGAAYREAFFNAIYEGGQAADEKTLVATAEKLGLDAATFVQAMRGSDVAELLSRSETITQQFQIKGTPTLVIDMQRVRLADKDPLEILQEEFGA